MRIRRKPKANASLRQRGAAVLLLATLVVTAALRGAAPSPPLQLRIDWLGLKPRSEIAHKLRTLQHDCSLPVRHYAWREGGFGMGSDLHAWGNALWQGLQGNFRVASPYSWLWAQACGRGISSNSNTTQQQQQLLSCYFTEAEPECSNNQRVLAASSAAVSNGRKRMKNKVFEWKPCGKPDWGIQDYTVHDFRAAATEFAFASSLSPRVVQEAHRQASLVFSAQNVPSNRLITVHIRWGDKIVEGGKNVAIEEYIQAVQSIVKEIKEPVYILLCTEDPEAVQAFHQNAAPSWNILLDQFYLEYLPYRRNREVVYNIPSHISNETKGRAGLWALGSLLVAMQANYYVLTTKSNWSRLMNELRKNVIDPTCNDCTRMIDLAKGEC